MRFHYPSRPLHPALDEFALEVRPGETVAIVGPSGAGKSTVFQLLLRFYDAQAGRVRIDGVDVREMALDSLRRRIGIVPQDAVIFSASALENIRYGRPEASDAEVVAAAQSAHCARLPRRPARGLRHLPRRARRAPVGRPAPAHRDRPRDAEERAAAAARRGDQRARRESERVVQAALNTAMRGRTTLVIAHRLATVKHADRIVVMDHGQVLDVGAHEELLARSGLYARLAAGQFSDTSQHLQEKTA